jgi:hypothetical protein
LPIDCYLKIAAADLMPEGLPDLSDPESQQFYDDVIADAELIVVDNLSTLCRGLKETMPIVGCQYSHGRSLRGV